MFSDSKANKFSSSFKLSKKQSNKDSKDLKNNNLNLDKTKKCNKPENDLSLLNEYYEVLASFNETKLLVDQQDYYTLKKIQNTKKLNLIVRVVHLHLVKNLRQIFMITG